MALQKYKNTKMPIFIQLLKISQPFKDISQQKPTKSHTVCANITIVEITKLTAA